MNNDELRKLIESQLPEGTDFDKLVKEFTAQLSDLPVEERDEILTADISEAELDIRAELARADTPEGFAHYVFCVTGMELPDHAYYSWVIPTYWAHGNITNEEMDAYYKTDRAIIYRYVLESRPENQDETIGAVFYAAREMAKTTYNTILWMSFRIGQEPWKANMIIQIGDTSAKRNASKVADIIDKYKGFSKVFPNVKPNKENSWGANGYEVIDTSMPEDEWNKLNSTRQDVSLAGYGYNSGVVIGKHPNGCLVIDDIHNENNTTSQVELDKVLSIVQGTIFYAMTDETWTTFVGTPWIAGDTLDFVSNTDQYYVVKTPAYFNVTNGEYKIASKWEEEVDKVYLWEELRGERWVRRKEKATIASEFKRMVLLTLSMSELQLYTYQSFPSDKVDWNWPQRAGVDPVATVTLVQGMEAGISSFAMAYALKTPFNSIVIAGGMVEKCDMEQGERYVVAYQRQFPLCRFAIETNNAGAAFISMVNRSPGMQWDGYHTSDIGGGDKAHRQYTFLQPLLKNGIVTISDEDTPFLNMARKYFNRFGLFKFAKNAPELDVADAIVLAVFAFPEVWYNWLANPVEPEKLLQQKKVAERDPLARMVKSLNTSR